MVLAGGLALSVSGIHAQTASSTVRIAQATSPEDQSDAQRHVRRPLRRVPIYPRGEFEPEGIYPHYDPGPNAVRDCVVHYVEDARSSGTVIVPRMHCYWRQR